MTLQLEKITPQATLRGIVPNQLVTVVSVQWYGSDAMELTYKTSEGRVDNQLLYRSDEALLELVEIGRPWSFDGDGAQFRLAAEARRIRLAHLFDPVLAVHTSLVEPLPHQITAVYEAMLPRQPLRFLLADDPGAGKTIMTGLLLKELHARGDLQRCLIVCPGSLVEQWQDELSQKFHLPFEILTNDKLESAHSGNWFAENDFVIARLDKLARDESAQQKLQALQTAWDLIVVDEAHKMSATFWSGEVRYTRRYQLGQLLSTLTRHFLLLTATPHNGKETDFQLFLALLDGDRFEGRFRDGVHSVEVSDLMRRMVKERLVKFDGKPLFPERIAYTIPYRLSDNEARLYEAVTEYVRSEFDRAEKLNDERRRSTVGFALTILQRRLASSPEAIYQSLRRRRERLESQQTELELLQRGRSVAISEMPETLMSAEDLEDLQDSPESEIAVLEEQIVVQATAAHTGQELRAEIAILRRLESLALTIKNSGEDRKWRELTDLLMRIFTPQGLARRVAEQTAPYGSPPIPEPVASPHQKLVIFTEHRDTLNYLQQKISTLVGDAQSVVVIHGGLGREQRRNAQESFLHDPAVRILVATDAAGEGINLQRAHLMVNYDLPWNPNRIEQRFGRIHRIGQTEVCYLWNLLAQETREGDVYHVLLNKLEQARKRLGGQVFDVLGEVQFEGQRLGDLLLQAIRYGERPEVRQRLEQVVANAFDAEQIEQLLEERALNNEMIDSTRLNRIREDMQRAEARRLQPHYIESFFMEAFKQLGGSIRQREPRRYEIRHTPVIVRQRDRILGSRESVLPRYERITFEKALIAPPNETLAAFVCPGHPLLDATIDVTLERLGEVLRRGAILVDENDAGEAPRVLFFLEHTVQDASPNHLVGRRVISRQLRYVEVAATGEVTPMQYAPYLDYRPLAEDEPPAQVLLTLPECAWISHELERSAQAYAIRAVVPQHLDEVRTRRLHWIEKARAAIKERLTKEIAHWDHRAADLRLQEQAGKVNARLNSQQARERANDLNGRLERRMKQLDLESQISALPPVVLGGVLVVPLGLLNRLRGITAPARTTQIDTQSAAARARAVVMEVERKLGYEPRDREFEKVGYDIESRNPLTGELRFIEVKGRTADADTITVTKNEVLYSLNQPEAYILAIVQFAADIARVFYVRQPFQREPDFGVTSVNYDVRQLLARAQEMG